MKKPGHMNWIIKEHDIEIRDGKYVQCYRINFDLSNEDLLKSWAKHIRRQYESDESLIESLEATDESKEEYLRRNVIPQKEMVKGPTMRSADFGEIIFSDLLEYIYEYTVPRCKMVNRATPVQSEQGTDIIAYNYYLSDRNSHEQDVLCTVESKMTATNSSVSTVSTAIEHSIKDGIRYSATLNYYRKKLKFLGEIDQSREISRFQKKSEKNFIHKIMAGAGISRIKVDKDIKIDFVDNEDIKLEKVDSIFLIYCKDLMDLIHELYERCIE